MIRRLVAEFPVVVLGRFVGTGALGQYTYSMRVASQPIGLTVNVGGYVCCRRSRDCPRTASDSARRCSGRCGGSPATAFPGGLLLVPLGMPAVVLIFGHQWQEAGYGAMALGPYCAALALDSVASEAWKAHGRPDMLPRMHGVSLALTVLCVGALAPFGLVGVCIGIL